MSDQIAFRAAKYTEELEKRDSTSPSKAAKFATIRYLDLMRRGRQEIAGYFPQKELETLYPIIKTVDWSREDAYDTFWAIVAAKTDDSFGLKLRRTTAYHLDVLVDMVRENDQSEQKPKRVDGR